MSRQLDWQNEQATCVVVTAAAGYGRSTWLERQAEGRPESVLVDDFDLMPLREQLRLAARVASLAPSVPVAIVTGAPLPAEVQAALGRPVVHVGPADLALDPAGLARALTAHGVDDPDLAATVHELTAGWPGLVQHLASQIGPHRESGRGREDLVSGFLAGPGAAFVRARVLARLPEPTRLLLRRLASLGPVSEELAVLVTEGSEDPLEDFAVLVRLGVLVPGEHEWQIVPLVSAVLDGEPGGLELRGLRAAATWYDAHALHLAAALTLEATGDSEAIVAFVGERGEQILGAGGAADVLRIVATTPLGTRDRAALLVQANAARMTGDTTLARRLFDEVADLGPPDSALVWRRAALHYSQAEYAEAIEVCEGVAAPVAGGDQALQVEESRRWAVLASARFMLGDGESAARDAARALASGRAADDDRALAAAHLAMALTATGARRENHLAASLQASSRAGDLALEARVLLNQADCLLSRADFLRAYEVGSRAVSRAQRASPPGTLVCAFNTVGEALTGLGRWDEARSHFERSLAVSRRCGLARTAGALHGLAEIDRLGERWDSSRAAYEEVVSLARDTGEHQVLVPALARLGGLIARGHDATSTARALALLEEAEAIAEPEFAVLPAVALGGLRLEAGEPDRAKSWSRLAVERARALQHQAPLAEALELSGRVHLAAGDRSLARGAWEEALEIWQRGGAAVAAARVRSALAELDAAGIRIRVLGAFEVQVDGEPVAVQAWRSRQARLLLKLLVARRGRHWSRGELCELLWPDDDPKRTGHRLSVLISAVRAVLDPTKSGPTDQYVVADLAGLRLDRSRLEIDLETFLRDADRAAALSEAKDEPAARLLLSELVETYRGEAFEDEPYEAWAQAAREEVRAVWLRSLRLTATLSGRRGDIDHAVTCLVRILSADGYDEATHRTLVQLLVRAGRHGEARRAHERWAQAMHAIEATPPPVLGVLISC